MGWVVILGNMIVIQAWALRRMVSVFNSVTRRPHIPREVALRRLLRNQGFDIPLQMPMRGPSASCGAIADEDANGSNGTTNEGGDDGGDTEQDEDESCESSWWDEGSESASCSDGDLDEFPPVTEAPPNPIVEEPSSFWPQPLW